jgi:hypothetical protein
MSGVHALVHATILPAMLSIGLSKLSDFMPGGAMPRS